MASIVAVIVAVMGSAQDWAGVEFTRTQFEQVLGFAAEKMLDPPEVGTQREQFAWRHAMELAAWNLTPAVDFVPAAYVQTLQAESWRPREPPLPLLCEKTPLAGVVLVREQVWQRNPPALKAAWQAWHDQHHLGKREVYCLLRWIEQTLPEDDRRQARLWAAWINAASGWLKGLNKHSDVIAARYWDKASLADQAADQADLGLCVTPCAAAVEGSASHCCVADVREGSAAWRADIRVGDRVEGLATGAFDPCAEPKLLRGAPKSTLDLRLWSIQRHRRRTVHLQRDVAVVHDVQVRALAPGLVHLRLADFVRGTARRVREALVGARPPAGAALRGLVLDMRDNTGGVLEESVMIADLLLPGGVIVKQRWRDRTDQPTATAAPDDVAVPIVLLVNRMCASACEVLTGALQDHKRALVLGEQTLGKASMQRVAKPSLMAEFYVKATIGHYLTPLDRDLDAVGTAPDVALPADATTQFAAPSAPMWHNAQLCVARGGQAVKRLAADVAPRRRVDPWLAMAADWLTCLAPAPVAGRGGSKR